MSAETTFLAVIANKEQGVAESTKHQYYCDTKSTGHHCLMLSTWRKDYIAISLQVFCSSWRTGKS